MKKTCLLFLFPCLVFSQSDSTKKAFSLSAYLETYYSYDFGNPLNHNRPSFVYSYNRLNEVNLNLGFVKAAYLTQKVRANFAIMAGTYANANLAAESGVLKNIFEANLGVKVSKTKQVWVDAGIFASHIGFESAIGKDCWNLTRSILADNSPYYFSGAKITYTSENEKWLFSGLVLNGWQHIQRANGNNTPAFGHQIYFKPNSNITLNSSSFIGSDTPDSTRKLRFFHNFYGQFLLTEKFGIITGFDIGVQQRAKGSYEYHTWYSPIIIVKYVASHKVSIAARGEYYSDPNQVIVSIDSRNGFQAYGYSLNLDYHIFKNIVWRIEGRGFTSNDKVFTLCNKPSFQNYLITSSIAISF